MDAYMPFYGMGAGILPLLVALVISVVVLILLVIGEQQ